MVRRNGWLLPIVTAQLKTAWLDYLAAAQVARMLAAIPGAHLECDRITAARYVRRRAARLIERLQTANHYRECIRTHREAQPDLLPELRP